MTTRAEERFYVERFVERMPGLRIVEQRERPDFILLDGDGEFGLEATRVFQDDKPRGGSKLMSAETHRSLFLARAAEHYYAHGGQPLLVSALLLRRWDIDLQYLTDRLLASYPLTPGEDVTLELCPDDDPNMIPYAVFVLCALPTAAGNYRDWEATENSVGWKLRLNASLLDSAIARKAAHIVQYRTAAPRVALLLYANARRHSGMMTWPEGARSPAAHGFDAVHLLLDPQAPVRLA